MKREQLIRALRKDAKQAGGELLVDMARGKGGHCVVRFKNRLHNYRIGRDFAQNGEDHPRSAWLVA